MGPLVLGYGPWWWFRKAAKFKQYSRYKYAKNQIIKIIIIFGDIHKIY